MKPTRSASWATSPCGNPSVFCKLHTIERQIRGGACFTMGDVPMVPPIPGESTSRRNFYVVAIYSLWGAILAALGLPALVYLLFPPKAKKGEEWIEVGDIGRLAPLSPVELTRSEERRVGKECR